jgi:hypothetical protein
MHRPRHLFQRRGGFRAGSRCERAGWNLSHCTACRKVVFGGRLATQSRTLRRGGGSRKSDSMEPRRVSKRRALLLGVLAVAVLANVAFALLPQRTETSQFVLEPLNTNGTWGGDRPSRPLPTFDGSAWSSDGKPVARLTDYLLNTDEWEVPHTFGKIMLIELPDNAGSDVFHLSIASLAENGICRVAVFQKGVPVTEQGLASAVRVRQYLDARGRSRECIDRVNGEA